MKDHNNTQEVSERDRKKQRNPFLVLLLREMFKWEVYQIYKELSQLNYCRYFILDKPIDSNYVPTPITEEQQKEVKRKGRSFVQEMIFTTQDFEYTNAKLDQLVSTISLLGRYRSWEHFAAAHNAMKEVTFAQWASSQNIYTEFSEDEIMRIDDDVENCLNEKVYEFEYSYMKNEVGFQIGYHRHLKVLTSSDDLQLEEFCSKLYCEKNFVNITEELKYENTWVAIDRYKKILLIISLTPISRATYSTLRREDVEVSEKGSWHFRNELNVCHITNLIYSSSEILEDFKKKFLVLFAYSQALYRGNNLLFCVLLDEFTEFLKGWGFQPDKGENKKYGLYVNPYNDLKNFIKASLDKQNNTHYDYS